MNKRILKDSFKNDGAVFGVLQNIFDPLVTEAIAKSGPDFIVFDLEHAGYAIHQLDSCILTAYGYNVPVLVRPNDISQSLIEQALEAGAQGVIIPTVETVEQCKLIVSSVKYGPRGTRGFDPTYPISRWMNDYSLDTFLEDANRDTFVCIFVETPLGFKNLPEMLKVDGIDCVMLGAADLTVRMGKPLPGTKACVPSDTEVTSMIDDAIKQIRAAGKIHFSVSGEKTIKKYHDLGSRMFIAPIMDSWVLTDYYRDSAKQLRAAIGLSTD